MKKFLFIIGYLPAAILTVVFYLLMGLWLLLFDLLQRIAYKIGGFKPQQQMVAILNYLLSRNLWVLGTRLEFVMPTESLPIGKTYIFILNHSSLNDIANVIWTLRHYNVRFIAKKELSKNIPSISYNIKRGGGLAINRKNREESMLAMQQFGQTLADFNGSIAIFPEGTRTKDGNLKPFKHGGLAALLAGAPNAIVVPIAIKGTFRTSKFPMPLFTKISWKVLPPIVTDNKSALEIAQEAQNAIANSLAT